MSNFGSGQWVEWESFPWGAPFLWTTLHTFGGNDAVHGNMSVVNRIPFDAVSPPAQVPGVVPAIGAGITPEGFDQNPAVSRSEGRFQVPLSPFSRCPRSTMRSSWRPRFGPRRWPT